MSRRKATILNLVCLCACFAVLVFVVRIVVIAIQGEPYRMTLRHADGRAVVQFSQPDRGLVSPEFPVDLPIEAPQVVYLRSGHLAVPGCKVEFYDTTLLPGRFKLRIGKVFYDVMPSRVIVGDEQYDWRPL